MGNTRLPKSAKLIIGIILSDEKVIKQPQRILENKFGKVDVESNLWPFDKTGYYEEEMGENLLRKFLSFENFIRPEQIAKIKNFTNKLEKKLSKNGKRMINLDPGYLTDSKLVLATTKDYSHRIYLGTGIYAEVTLYFKERSFRYFDYTYPDYRSAEYITFFNAVRKIYLEQIKSVHRS